MSCSNRRDGLPLPTGAHRQVLLPLQLYPSRRLFQGSCHGRDGYAVKKSPYPDNHVVCGPGYEAGPACGGRI